MDFKWIRFVAIFLLAIRLYIHLLNIDLHGSWIKSVFASIILGGTTYFSDCLVGKICMLFAPILLLEALSSLFHYSKRVTITIGILAYGIGYTLYLFVGFILTSFVFVWNSTWLVPSAAGMYIITGILTIALCESIFKIRKFQKGLKLDPNSSFFKICFVIGIMLLGCILSSACFNL